MSATKLFLDHTSTSPTKEDFVLPSHEPLYHDTFPQPRCIYANVWFAYQIEGKSYGITQGCCNHWDCPRCGQIRARQEYGRIVHGIHLLSVQHETLYFQTITCRGKSLSAGEADENYLSWTNRLLDAYRLRVKREGGAWVYVQVTERQKRGHPHSHFLTTFQPGDLCDGLVEKWRYRKGTLERYQKRALRSEWLRTAVNRSGLGDQYDISVVRNEAAASRYVAKYMFKPSNFTTDWPKGWKRVRYSQSFPQLPELKSDAFVLRTWQDWDALSRCAAIVTCGDEETFDYAGWKLRESSVVVLKRKSKQERQDKEIIF